MESIRQERTTDMAGSPDLQGPRAIRILALSGGAEYGAFGAGFLNGWSDSGTRPDFKIVTGISTGAIIAPFAFLGPEYDNALKLAYTEIHERDVYRSRLLSLLWRDSLFKSKPLARTIARFIDWPVVDAIDDAWGLVLFSVLLALAGIKREDVRFDEFGG